MSVVLGGTISSVKRFEKDMSHSTHTTTAAELLAMPGDGHRYELVAGELRMMSPAGGRHGRLAQKIGRRIGDHVERYALGETYAAETGFLLRQNPDTVRAPDFAFVSRKKLGDLADHPGYLPLVPDLVVEVVSPSDRASEVEEKVLDWLDVGVAAVLVVDPQTKSVRHHRSIDSIQIHTAGAMDLTHVIGGFHLDVSELFA
ncbi:MAG: Uma2 family endonuclease [Pirellulaceae bacterium]